MVQVDFISRRVQLRVGQCRLVNAPSSDPLRRPLLAVKRFFLGFNVSDSFGQELPLECHVSAATRLTNRITSVSCPSVKLL